jgi:hypothetical protein
VIDWHLYLNTGRCAADALERVYRAATTLAAQTGVPEVVELPAGVLTCLRPPLFRAAPGGWVVFQGPATRLEMPYLLDGKTAPQPKERTEHGWGVVMPEPKIVEVN